MWVRRAGGRQADRPRKKTPFDRWHQVGGDPGSRPRTRSMVSASSGPLVGAVALDPGEAQGDPTRIVGTGLDVVEGDLHHQLRPHVDDVALAADGPGLQGFGLPAQQLVGHALEGLAQHDEAARHRIAGAEVQVGQPALPAAAAPLGRQHHQIQGVRQLQLQPLLAAAAGAVQRAQPLGHGALVPGGQRRRHERVGLLLVRGLEPRHQHLLTGRRRPAPASARTAGDRSASGRPASTGRRSRPPAAARPAGAPHPGGGRTGAW